MYRRSIELLAYCRNKKLTAEYFAKSKLRHAVSIPSTKFADLSKVLVRFLRLTIQHTETVLMPSIEHADVDADAAQRSNFVKYNSSFL
jgi:hypothetical protein